MVSNSRVDSCGEILRKARRDEIETDSEEYLKAIADIEDYRASFESPLSSLVLELEEISELNGEKIPVASRPKQINRIGKKLLLQPRMRLSQMDDLGGCRIVAPDLGTVEKLADQIRKKYEVISESDYRENSRTSGYRALHLIVFFSGRKIEIQLRTTKQHSWAEIVETLDKKYDLELKDGIGPTVLKNWLPRVSEALFTSDQNETLSSSKQFELTVSTNAAVEWMTEADNESN